MALLQPLAIAAVLLIALQLIDGTRWLMVFPPLVALVVIWLGQAIHAYRRAVELGWRPGGEMQVALFVPVAVAMMTTFWLIGGRHGSPSATLESYVLAWMSGRAEAAAALWVNPPAADGVGETWTTDSAYLAERIAALAAQYGPTSGLDSDQPFDSLRFAEPAAAGLGRQQVQVDIVRRQRVDSMILGIVPTASQETVVIERAGTITLVLVEQPPLSWLPFGRLSSAAWRIEAVSIGPP